MPRISPAIDLVGLSPVPVGAQISPPAREFRASLRRIADVPDSLAEGSQFELSGRLRHSYPDVFQGARPGSSQLRASSPKSLNHGVVDVVVVYKVDRLTRSLADFAKMVESFKTR